MRIERHLTLSLKTESFRYCELREHLLAEIPDLDAETRADNDFKPNCAMSGVTPALTS